VLRVGTPGASLVALAVRVQEEWEPQPVFGSVDDDYELADQRFRVEAACRKLPVRERLVLHVRFIEDRTQTDIAATIWAVADAGLSHPERRDRAP
jgi:DNA-directed RNA polymerase specialized sigma subunit